MKTENTIRESNFELLRIICMVLIIMHHYALHGGVSNLLGGSFSAPIFGLQSIAIGGKVGVVCFILLTGYFLVDSQKFLFKKIFNLWGEIFFYSIVCFGIDYFFVSLHDFSLNELISAIFPIMTDQYWFASTYLFLLLLSPLINKLVIGFTKKKIKSILLFAIVVWSIVPNIWNLIPISPKPTLQCNSLLWFCVIYLIGGYIKKYTFVNTKHLKEYFVAFLIGWISIMLYIALIDYLGAEFGIFRTSALSFSDTNSIIILAMSIALFMGFRNLDMGYRKGINMVAKTTFGIYLIHDNPYMRSFIWQDIFNNATYVDSLFLALHVILSVTIVFFTCSLLDACRLGAVKCMRGVLSEKRYTFRKSENDCQNKG